MMDCQINRILRYHLVEFGFRVPCRHLLSIHCRLESKLFTSLAGDQIDTPAYALPVALNVHSSVSFDFLAPIARSSRSVVAQSAPIPFSSCTIDLKPRVARGSCSICRSFRFWFHSLIALKTMLHPLAEGPDLLTLYQGVAYHQ